MSSLAGQIGDSPLPRKPRPVPGSRVPRADHGQTLPKAPGRAGARHRSSPVLRACFPRPSEPELSAPVDRIPAGLPVGADGRGPAVPGRRHFQPFTLGTVLTGRWLDHDRSEVRCVRGRCSSVAEGGGMTGRSDTGTAVPGQAGHHGSDEAPVRREHGWRAGSQRFSGRVVMGVGWPLCAGAALIGYHALLEAAGMTGAALTTALVLSVPFVMFLTTGAWTWALGVVAAVRRQLPEAVRWPDPDFAEGLTAVTAVVFPIKNEDTAQVFANIAAMRESLGEAAAEHLFDFYVVSNSDDPDCLIEEELAWHTASQESARVFYWRRHREAGRKPANIAEFCERWGSRYECMVVMDADSLMTADCLLTLVGLMEANPRSALMQSLTDVVNGRTLFARLQQFSGWSDKRIVAWGERVWQGPAATYYGHNAIIRIAPFMAHCGLPRLSGPAPFGGDVLSHDYVEAALLRRAGWDVWLIPELHGSYEDCPATLEEFFRRDRRWCQGDILNLRLLTTPKLPLAGRIRFVLSALRDMSAPMLLTLCALIVVFADSPPYAAAAIFIAFLVWDFSCRMSWAGVPAFGLGISLATGTARQSGLPLMRSFANSVLVQILWAVAAPTRLLTYTGFAAQILCGRDVGWSTPRRAGSPSTLRRSTRLYWPHVLTGLATLSALVILHSWALWWFAPALLAWITTVPLTLAFDSPHVGFLARRAGVLLTPEEHTPPKIMTRAHELGHALRGTLPHQPWQAALNDPDVMAVHHAFLPHQAPLTVADKEAAAAAATRYRAGNELSDTQMTALLRDPHQAWTTTPPAAPTVYYPAVHATRMPEQQLTRTK
ncbi:glucans biosynthesis glucosyltransferase MdoH [Streptomyces sp. NPDC091268]|uniref:glucans biosynthesis glucosyltransferase MdoH n=1 Tax=Streptomyces sp. NPDC091268 TaxID=3365979 RepID=UPI0037FC654C